MSELPSRYSTDGAAVATPEPDATPGRGATDDPPISELFRKLADDSSTLVRQEIALAKAELKESAAKVAKNAVAIPIWGGVAMVGGLVLVAFLVLLLGDILNNYWLSALIIGVLFTATGGLMAAGAAKRLSSISFAPETTIQTLKQDRTWVKSEIDGLKRDLTE